MMGVLNVTPDSFSDGGKFMKVDAAMRRALEMIEEGADIVDIGGESTGPGSVDVPGDHELERVIPVFEKLRGETEALLSIDTYKSTVALHAFKVGADLVNDVTAFRGDPTMVNVVADHQVPAVIMYSKDDTPRTTSEAVDYEDVVGSVKNFLQERIDFAAKAGVKKDRLIIDPGMGAFVSSNAKYSLQILKGLRELSVLKRPVLVGASRKSFIGKSMGLNIDERLEGGLAVAAWAVIHGASIVRTHDVKETRRVLDMIYSIKNS